MRDSEEETPLSVLCSHLWAVALQEVYLCGQKPNWGAPYTAGSCPSRSLKYIYTFFSQKILSSTLNSRGGFFFFFFFPKEILQIFAHHYNPGPHTQKRCIQRKVARGMARNICPCLTYLPCSCWKTRLHWVSVVRCGEAAKNERFPSTLIYLCYLYKYIHTYELLFYSERRKKERKKKNQISDVSNWIVQWTTSKKKKSLSLSLYLYLIPGGRKEERRKKKLFKKASWGRFWRAYFHNTF